MPLNVSVQHGNAHLLLMPGEKGREALGEHTCVFGLGEFLHGFTAALSRSGCCCCVSVL